MYNTMSGYRTLSPPQISIFQKNTTPGIPFFGTTESAIYRQPSPTGYPRSHTAFVSVKPAASRGFTFSSPQRFTTVTPDSSNPTVNNPLEGNATAAEMVSSTNKQLEQQVKNLANTKEKTPMCLINELARFNKVQHEYCLTDEQGPAHKKTFFVKLKLGDEEFTATGASIKKAQHEAASVALKHTKYPHPAPKKTSSSCTDFSQTKASNLSVTPTVELNALAMKRGELAVYRPIERKAVSLPVPYQMPSYGGAQIGGGYYGQRFRHPKRFHQFFVALTVGEKEFIGEGETLQTARHNAASMALRVLKSLPLPTKDKDVKTPTKSETDGDSAMALTESAPVPTSSKSNDSVKSEISLVHEIALKRNYTVEFEILKEFGPPHMRTFITACKCGDLITEGEGSSKKLSKKCSAEKMVEELKKLPPLPPAPEGTKPKKSVKPKQTKNLVKNVLNNLSAGVNPISRLIQIQQAKKEKEPVFSTVEERGQPRAREFLIQVTVGDNTCTGVGPNKRLAKRTAAEQMLQMLGYSLLAPQPSKPAIKSGSVEGQNVSPSSSPTRPPGGSAGGDKRVTFVEPVVSVQVPITCATVPTSGRHSGSSRHSSTQNAASDSNAHGKDVRSGATTYAARPIDQLSYLAKVMNFELTITIINPKDESKREYLSVINIVTNNISQFYNSTGPSIESAVDNAALDALCKLSEFGLSSKQGQNTNGTPGDT